MRLIIWAKSLSLVTITAPASLAASNIILPVAPSIPNSAIGWASTAKLPVIHDAAPGRHLGINPQDQAATTGWSTRWLANFKHAEISSASRSGSSINTSSDVSPFANRSSTSITRIRMLRIHGLPPHCSGSTVIRSARLAIAKLLPHEFYHGGYSKLPI